MLECNVIAFVNEREHLKGEALETEGLEASMEHLYVAKKKREEEARRERNRQAKRWMKEVPK